ncbi:MAG: hypothetical protein M1816_001827 [Peltula sp. TS41687]|nr:MAG: hypothetical protein M1816_001827 [Peltula sp. TS41687]
MEEIHGVDVSWLHRPHKEHNHWSNPVTEKPTGGAPASPVHSNATSSNAPATPPSGSERDTQKPTSANHHSTRRPHQAHRTSPEKSTPSAHGNGSIPKSPATTPLFSPSTARTPPSSPSTARRNSWISGLTSKFSSGAASSASTGDGAAQNGRSPLDKPMPLPQPRRASLTHSTPPPPDVSVPYTPATPKPSHPSFLQSALRRFQSSSGQLPGMGRLIGGGGLCERRIMNVDVNRERCRVPGLDQAKLRRVAFCVDVEIAGGPGYVNNDVGVVAKRGRKEQDRKLKGKEEGEALKHPESTKGETSVDTAGTSSEQVERKQNPTESAAPSEGGRKEISKKKEKKKKSEAERKEKKEKKRKQAEADGTIPIENLKNSDGSSCNATPSDGSPSRFQSQYHPTTDPLRIYRRCCQLRETNALKLITEQLSAPKSVTVATPGVVACLDLSDQRIQLADIVTLADWLAVVPVKKLKLDNCDLGDEAVRVILGGLLASKIPDTQGRSCSPDRHKSGNLSDEDVRKHPMPERYGVCERLSLKNNPKIGRDGWRYISLFLHLCRSIKAIDLSMIPFPRASKSGTEKNTPVDMASLLSEAISKRLAGSHFEELIMSECGLSTDDINKVIQGVSKCRLRRLGLASNHLTPEGVRHIARFLKQGICEGLDLGGNDLQSLQVIADALDHKNPLYALSLSDCNLIPSSLSHLFPALVSLPNFRFIDLSHNQQLFSTQPNALGLLRKYLPQLRQLKRIHLEDSALSSEHAIALAEILPEVPSLAHLSILENSQLSTLASAQDDASQEEACALYASMMAAVKVSKTIICIDIDVPSPDSCEVVKALAKQVVAYCLRNMERGPVAEYDSTTEVQGGGEKQVDVPDVLLHIVGQVEGYPQDLGDVDEPAPDHDYVIGGTGVVKALGVCLGNNSNDSRRWSGEVSAVGSGTATPKARSFKGEGLGKGKAKEMSKNLLGSARKIRARLQPALIRESKTGDEMSYRRLLFLDQTLERMIQRFEDEYPECRLHPPTSSPSTQPRSIILSSSVVPTNLVPPSNQTTTNGPTQPATFPTPSKQDEERESYKSPHFLHAHPPRHGSDVSLASRALSNEEGRMHRFGQQVRRDILRPQTLDHAHGTTGLEPPEPEHLQMLRQRIEALGGMELKERVMREGPEAVLRDLTANAEHWHRLASADPESFEAFRQAQELMERNERVVVVVKAEEEE